MATTRTRTPKDDVPMATPPPAPFNFDDISFPKRKGRTATVSGEQDALVATMLERQEKLRADGVADDKIFMVLDLSNVGDKVKIERWRMNLSNAIKRAGDQYKISFRTIPDTAPDAVKEKFLAYERHFGTDIENATHCFTIETRDSSPAAATDSES